MFCIYGIYLGNFLNFLFRCFGLNHSRAVLKNQISMINGNKLILDINSGKIEIFDDKLDQERVKGVLVDQSNKGEQ